MAGPDGSSLAGILGFEPAELAALAASAASRYTRLRLPRPGRGPRVIHAPDEALKAAQRRVLRRLLARLPVSRHAHGFVPGRSAITAARAHARREFVVTFDVRDFFPSVKAEAVRAVAGELGLAPPDADALVRLTTLAGCLPQGAPTSPYLANLAFRSADARLAGLAAPLDLAYTRYADDLAFSGDARATRIAASVGAVLAESGFLLAAEKTRVLPRSARQEVCGLVVNEGVRLPREARRLLRAIAHEAATRGLGAAARGRGDSFGPWLAGHLAYLAAVMPEEAEKLLAEFDRAAEADAPSFGSGA